jgi:hypothetical protein
VLSYDPGDVYLEENQERRCHRSIDIDRLSSERKIHHAGFDALGHAFNGLSLSPSAYEQYGSILMEHITILNRKLFCSLLTVRTFSTSHGSIRYNSFELRDKVVRVPRWIWNSCSQWNCILHLTNASWAKPEGEEDWISREDSRRGQFVPESDSSSLNVWDFELNIYTVMVFKVCSRYTRWRYLFSSRMPTSWKIQFGLKDCWDTPTLLLHSLRDSSTTTAPLLCW